MQAMKHASKGFHPSFKTHGRRHQNVQNRGISGPTKGTDVLQILFFEKKKVLRTLENNSC